MTQPTQQLGMTITEMLIAISLLSFLAATLLPSVGLTIRASQKLKAVTESLEARRNDREVIQTAFNTLLAPHANISEKLLTGSSDKLSFQIIDFEGHIVNLVMISKNQGVEFSVSGQDTPERALILFTNIANPRFSYLGKSDDRSELRWRFVWSEPHPPVLLKISNAGQNGSVFDSVELLITPETSLTCEFDPISRKCR